MNFADLLRSARTSAATAYQQFIIENPKFSNHVFLFFEGHDDPSFYLRPLREYLGDAQIIHIFKCGNKREVYNAHSKIMQRPDIQNAVLFFVDKDLSDILGENYPSGHNIYVTDYYSIENYLVTIDIFLAIVMETFHFPYKADKIDYRLFINLFNRELINFHRLIRPIMAWFIYSKRNGLQPQLDNIDLSSIFIINDNMEIEASQERNEIFDNISIRCNIGNLSRDSQEIENIENTLSTLDAKSYTRGKYEVWFLIKFVEKLISVLEQTEKVKVRVRISEGTAISFLAPRIPVPLSLENFIQRNLKFII